MTYHARVAGPNGQVYQCEHNHRTMTAASTCANSSATRRMAQMEFNRAAVQAAQAAAQAKKRAEERAAAEAQRIADREASAARRAAAQAAAEEAKAAKRAAKLAKMSPRRAWKRMTPEERLLRTAEAELEAYGEIMSPDAKAAYSTRAAKRAVPKASVPPATDASLSPGRVADGVAPKVPGSENTPGGKPLAGSSAGFGGDGLFVVGLDIKPGVYRTAGPVGERSGYFALLKSTNTEDIVDNGVVRGPATITVGAGVKAVEVRTCQPWHWLGDNLDEVIAEANGSTSTASRHSRDETAKAPVAENVQLDRSRKAVLPGSKPLEPGPSSARMGTSASGELPMGAASLRNSAVSGSGGRLGL